jgi:hypothetical protein
MKSGGLSKKSTKETIGSIISENEELHLIIREKFNGLDDTLINLIFLVKLGYTFKETQDFLEIPEKNISEAYTLLMNANYL